MEWTGVCILHGTRGHHPLRGPGPHPRTLCSPVLVILYILGQIHIEDDEVVHVAPGKRLLRPAAPRLAGPLPHANEGVARDVGGGLNVLQDVLQRDVPLRPGRLPVGRREAKVPGMNKPARGVAF